MQAIYQVNSDVYIAKTASGLVWSGSTASGRLSYSRTLEHIGGKYFDTDQGILSWETTRFIKANTDITNFVRTCPSVEWRYGLFSCPKTRSILTENGKYMTGILDIRNHLIERSGSIIEVTGGTLGKSWSQTGTVDLANIAIVDGVLYDTHTGTLTPRDPKGTIISTPLESIGHASSLEDDIILIGMRD